MTDDRLFRRANPVDRTLVPISHSHQEIKMSVNPIGSALSSSLQHVASAPAGNSSSAKSSALATAVEEANETKATKIEEAQSGDQVARQKLRAIEARQPQGTSDKPAKKAVEPGKGAAVDHDA